MVCHESDVNRIDSLNHHLSVDLDSGPSNFFGSSSQLSYSRSQIIEIDLTGLERIVDT